MIDYKIELHIKTITPGMCVPNCQCKYGTIIMLFIITSLNHALQIDFL